MRSARVALLAFVTIGLVVAVGVLRSGARADAQPASPGQPRATSPVTASRAIHAPAKRVIAAPELLLLPELPASLQGTDVDGSLDVDSEGHLIAGPGVMVLFDYYFSATGEESEATIRARIAAYARAHLDQPALGEALGLLDRYMAYRHGAAALRPEATATVEARLRAIHDLRREHFGEAAGALFGDDERAAAVAVAKSHVLLDATLSAEEREDGLAAAEEALPEADRKARAQSGAVLQRSADEQALRAAGADEAEIQRFRSGTLGPAAAERLGALDRQRAAWKARVEAFRAERDVRCPTQADPRACETALLEAAFDTRERLRVGAIVEE